MLRHLLKLRLPLVLLTVVLTAACSVVPAPDEATRRQAAAALRQATQTAAAVSTPSPTPVVLTEQQLDPLLQAFALIVQMPGAPSPRALAAATWNTVTLRLGLDDSGGPARPPTGGLEASWEWLEARLRAAVADQATDPAALLPTAFPALAQAASDCHTRYAPSFEQENARLEGSTSYAGIGITPGVMAGEAPLVLEVVAGSPAAHAGVRLGDRLVAVDQQQTLGRTRTEVVELLRGAAGTEVRLSIVRPGAAQLLQISVPRGTVQMPFVVGQALPHPGATARRIGQIAPTGVAPPAVGALDATIRDLQAAGARAWILDLRNNPGGDLPSLTQLAGFFLPRGRLLATEVLPDGSRTTFRAEPQTVNLTDSPLVVLVNRNTVSAAEVLAAALRDHRSVPIVGEPTDGCFGTARLNRLVDGSALWLTAGTLLVGRDERSLHGDGLQPDRDAPVTAADLAAGRDPALDLAVTLVAQPSGQ